MKTNPKTNKELLAAAFTLIPVESALKVLGTLTPREADVIVHRYGLRTTKKTLETIGKTHGVGRERIRQIQAKAERKLMHPTRLKHLKEG